MPACGGGSIHPGLLGIATQAPRVLVSVTGREVLLLLLLHLLLALATAWWLRRGEVALFTVLRSLAVAACPGIAENRHEWDLPLLQPLVGRLTAEEVELRVQEHSGLALDLSGDHLGGAGKRAGSGCPLGDQGVLLAGEADSWREVLSESETGVLDQPAGADSGGAIGEFVQGNLSGAQCGGAGRADLRTEEDAAR
jgi:hypothetical protein